MGNTTPHVTQIRDILNRVAGNLRKLPKPDVETLVIEDPAQAVFELVRVGWHSGERIDNTVIFARVRDGKVWIEEDNTDLTFADELMRGRSGLGHRSCVSASGSASSRRIEVRNR